MMTENLSVNPMKAIKPQSTATLQTPKGSAPGKIAVQPLSTETEILKADSTEQQSRN